MQYGYFDDNAMEYVVTRPDTPTSWSNYLGSTEYGAVITNNAGGYGFYKSGAQGRFMRLMFNSVPMDQPGRYFYLRDMESKDYWSASWQPVGKPLDKYKSICRHGTAYTIFETEYEGIKSEAKYYVPLKQTFEYWRLKVTNTGNKTRKLRAFTYCEFSNQWNTTQDLVNLQYSLFLSRGKKVNDNMLDFSIHENLHIQNPNEAAGGGYMGQWMALVGAPLSGYDTDRTSFIGTYGSYKEPEAVINGECKNSECFGDSSCGSMQADIVLETGESKEIMVLLGIDDANKVGVPTVKEFGSIERANKELEAIKAEWHAKLGSFKANTPDDAINHTVNVWGLYNNLITFAWSRAASLVYNGERDGLGYRDSVQDVLGVSAAIPSEARARLVLMLSGQFNNGGALPVISKDFVAGKQKMIPAEEFRSDDCQWFFNSVPTYIKETGDFDFYNEVVPYADSGEATVYCHLKQALLFNLERMGANGLPCGLLADWNDCLKLGYHGESLFVAFQLRYGLTTFAEISERLGKPEEAKWALGERDKLDAAIQKKCWDGKWFVWAIAEDGTVYGTQTMEEGQIYFNTQVWAVLSGASTPDQTKACLEAVKEKLATPYGLMLCAPPFTKTNPGVMSSVVYLHGIKENAGIFNHTQGWGVIAECLTGNGDRAYEYAAASLPAFYNDKAEVRQSEPYVIGQTTYSTYSKRPGNTRVSWLSGAATWNYYSLTQYMLGIKPEYDGITINPCIKSSWDGFSVERRWRGMNLNIEVKNPQHICKGIEYIEVDGQKIESAVVPVSMLKDGSKIVAYMGKNAVAVESRL